MNYEYPKNFKIAGFDIKVDMVDKTEDNNFGYWNDVLNTIVIAKNISLKNGELTKLSDRQIKIPFSMNFFTLFNFSQQKYSEVNCNIFANFMLKFLETKIER